MITTSTSPTIPFSDYHRVFGATDAARSQKALAAFQRSYGPIVKQRLSPLVLVFLVYAPQNRELARQLLAQNAATIRSLHLVVTPTHAMCVLNTGSATNTAWALVAFETETHKSSSMVCVHQAPGMEPMEKTTPLATVGEMSGAMAHAMALVETLPQAAMLYFASVRQAMHCGSLGHLDPKMLRWARKQSGLAAHCPAAPPPPVPAAVVAEPVAVPSYAKRTLCAAPEVAPIKQRSAPPAPVAQEQVQARILNKQAAAVPPPPPPPPSVGKLLLRKQQQKVLRNSLKQSGVVRAKAAAAAAAGGAAAVKKRKLKASWEIHADKRAQQQQLRAELLFDLEGEIDDDCDAFCDVEDELDAIILQKQQQRQAPQPVDIMMRPPMDEASTQELMMHFQQRVGRCNRIL